MNEVTNSRRGRWIAMVVAVLALAVVACVCSAGTDTPTLAPSDTTTGTTTGDATTTTGGTTTGDATTTTGGTTDGSTEGEVNLEVANQTDASLCYVYIAPFDDITSWGEEVLGEDTVIGAGETYTLSGPAGTFDVIMEDCGHNVVAWFDDLNLTTDTGVTVTGSPDQLVIDNQSTFEICYIYISSPGAEVWGHSQLNPANPILPGQSRSFAVAAGTWDLKAETCDGQSLERLGSELSGEMIWTLTTE